jgi:hypothetical protein
MFQSGVNICGVGGVGLESEDQVESYTIQTSYSWKYNKSLIYIFEMLIVLENSMAWGGRGGWMDIFNVPNEWIPDSPILKNRFTPVHNSTLMD